MKINMTNIQENRENDVKQLNSFLRGELSAVETYRQALDKVEDVHVKTVLHTGQSSHEQRANILNQHIRKLGGEPATESGVWGAFAKAVEGGAKLFGTSSAIAALEEGEDHGLADYRSDLPELSLESRRMVASQLLPAQEKTHDALARLKAAL